VSTKTFGAAINDKLRYAGITTSTESYSRDRAVLEQNVGMPQGFKEVKTLTPEMENLRGYVQTLASQFYNNMNIRVNFANWMSATAALYEHGAGITFNTLKILKHQMATPVSSLTATCLHELAHCMGDGHDGVYDHEFESLVNRHTKLLVEHPELYKPFEPELYG
jgi:hypothetical protein